MRHGKKINHLGRKYGHRSAMLTNMANSLIMHKRISTTTAKAKELRGFVEPLITKSKDDSSHSRRVIFSYLQNKEAIKELFSTVVGKIGDRPGGYTRILKTHNRKGDNAEMCMMELVDFNELMLEQKVAKKSSEAAPKRTRRGKKKVVETTSDAVEVASENVKSTDSTTPEANASKSSEKE